jgi:hypothetical protein
VANFPALKTGAYAQYPSDRARRFATSVYRFLDGSEQRFAHHAGPLRRWTIRLQLLDESELATLEQFFVSQNGRAGTFSFTDPFDGTVRPSCSFASDTAVFEYADVGRGAAIAVIRENPS